MSAYATGPRAVRPPRFSMVVGHPKTIALKSTKGMAFQSPRTQKIDVRFSLTSGEDAWFPVHVAETIDSLRLAIGEPFTICLMGGDRYDVQRAAPAPRARPEPRYAEPGPLPESRREPPPPPVNGQGDDAQAILARCYLQAIAVTVAALEAARAKGITILPTHEGLQAAAATLFIAETRR